MNKEQINVLRKLVLKELTRTKNQFDAKQDQIIKGAIVELDIMDYSLEECRSMSPCDFDNQKINGISQSAKSDPRLWKNFTK